MRYLRILTPPWNGNCSCCILRAANGNCEDGYETYLELLYYIENDSSSRSSPPFMSSFCVLSTEFSGRVFFLTRIHTISQWLPHWRNRHSFCQQPPTLVFTISLLGEIKCWWAQSYTDNHKCSNSWSHRLSHPKIFNFAAHLSMLWLLDSF